MKAICLIESGPDLVLADVPCPQPGQGEVLLEVRAAGATPAELSWFPTLHTKDGAARKGAVPGHEFSGVIAAVGEGIGSLRNGPRGFRRERLVCAGARWPSIASRRFSRSPRNRSH